MAFQLLSSIFIYKQQHTENLITAVVVVGQNCVRYHFGQIDIAAKNFTDLNKKMRMQGKETL